MDEFIAKYIGTIPQWGVLFVLIIAVIRTSPDWLKTWAALRVARSNRNRERIRELEDDVKECQKECTEHKELLRTEIHGLKRANLAKDATVMRAILKMSNDPDVKRQLELLEALALEPPIFLEGNDDERA